MGSQNWSQAANYTNDESLIVIENSQISDLYGQEYERIKKTSSLGAPNWLTTQIRSLETECRNLGFIY
jgi:phosphatidylserine/phosphatidylglycerophosphate/cardiolipin synthase-like enzyme